MAVGSAPTRALVTGGAGFIGSHLVDRLLDLGHYVTVLDNFSTGRRANLLHRRDDARLAIVEDSVVDASVVDDLVAAHPLVFHLAAAVGVSHIVADPLGSILTNVRGAENVLGAAHRHRARVVLASTSEVYGRSDAVPFVEDGDRVLGPTWIHRWSYSTGKAIDEHLAFAYADKGLEVSIVRYFNSYGPRLDESGYGSVIARFVSQALKGEALTVHGDGRQTRCFTYVTDTVTGTFLAGTTRAALGTVVNVGSSWEISIVELAERIISVTGSTSVVTFVPYEQSFPRGFQDTRRRVPDITRARNVLGFEAKVSLDDGLARTVDWCRQHYAPAVLR